MLKSVAAVFTIIAASAALAGPGKPGLWEDTVLVNFTEGGPKIPPEALEKMKKMGIQIPIGQPVIAKTCITPEMAARSVLPQTTRERDACKFSQYDASANPVSAELVCDGAMKGRGTVNVNYSSSTSFSGTMEFKGTDSHGAPLAMQDTFSGKWLSDDCGDVKPVAAPK